MQFLKQNPPPPLFLKSKRLNRKYSPIHPNYYKWIQQNPLNHSKLNVAYQSPLLDPEKLELCALGPTPLSQLSIGQQRKCRKMKFPAFPLSKSNWHNWFGFFNFFFFFTQKNILIFFPFLSSPPISTIHFLQNANTLYRCSFIHRK